MQSIFVQIFEAALTSEVKRHTTEVVIKNYYGYSVSFSDLFQILILNRALMEYENLKSCAFANLFDA